MGEIPVWALSVGGLTAVVAFVAVVWMLASKSGAARELEHQRRAKSTAEETSARLLDEARRDAENVRKGAVVAGKEDVLKLREDFEKDARQRRNDLEREEKRVQDRESQIDKTRDILLGREAELQTLAIEVGKREIKVTDRVSELDKLISDERHRLEQLAGLSAQDAKAELIRRLEDEAHATAANRLRNPGVCEEKCGARSEENCSTRSATHRG